MDYFYGCMQGNHNEATRTGDKYSGLQTTAASWAGCVTVRLYYDEDSGEDRFVVEQDIWEGSGVKQLLATGVVGQRKYNSKGSGNDGQ